MEKKVVSFRAEPELIEALEALRQPEDSSISQVALRLLREVVGLATGIQQTHSHFNSVNTAVNGVDADQIRDRLNKLEETVNTAVNNVDVGGLRDRVEELEEQLASAIALRKQLAEIVNGIVDERIQHPLDILSDHQRRLSELEKREAVSVSGEVVNDTVNERIQLVAKSNQSTEEEAEGSAIAPLHTDNVVSSSQAEKLSSNQITNKVKSIYRTLKTNGLEFPQTVIRQKILEMYPNASDWLTDDARKEVINALTKPNKSEDWQEKTADFLDEVKWQ